MKRIIASFLILCIGLVGVDVHFNESRASLKAVAGFNQAAVAITGGTISGVTVSDATGVPVKIAQWGVPVILASSGTMGNNGAVSGMTALPTTYSGGAWLYLPANAIQAGSSAGFYWFVGSSTTAGTVYNSTWDGSGIPAIGTTTAFVTTGPGAFTGIATGEFAIATLTIPANTLGASGQAILNFMLANNTAAGAKNFRVRNSTVLGTTLVLFGASTAAAGNGTALFANAGVTNRQKISGSVMHGSSLLGSAPVYMSEDTTSAWTVVLTMEKATATNHAIWESGSLFFYR